MMEVLPRVHERYVAKKKKIGPLDIYPLLPKSNCGKCEAKVCMAFAAELAERTISLDECPEILLDKYKANLAKLRELLKPPVKEVTIGTGNRRVKIGGQIVLRRHEHCYFNPVPIAITVDDGMPEEEILKRVGETTEFKYIYIGRELKLNAIAIRSKLGDPSTFERVVKKVADATDMPLVLWSFDPAVLERGLLVVQGRRPLLYAATKDNWREMGELALKYKCPLVIHSPYDLKMLKSLAKTLIVYGVEDLVLDPGAGFGEGVRDFINNLTMLRIAAIKEADDLLGFPLMGSPGVVWESEGRAPEVIKWEETCLASMMILRYVDLLILRSTDMWTILPHVILRENIYTDPRKPVSVEPGLRTIGKPDEGSPVMLTSNFALTYFAVTSDIEASKVSSYLLVADTEGISVESAIAGRKLTADKVADVLSESGVESKVKHRKLIVPGFAARLRGEIEDLTHWEVIVGPRDSSAIPKFLSEHWAVEPKRKPVLPEKLEEAKPKKIEPKMKELKRGRKPLSNEEIKKRIEKFHKSGWTFLVREIRGKRGLVARKIVKGKRKEKYIGILSKEVEEIAKKLGVFPAA
jgi:acetyl-CoA decarbonylase/synthase complex subunit gamma